MRLTPGIPMGIDDPKASELFIDREPESSAFKKALAVHRQNIDADVDAGQSRRNVLCYYGVGGLGKSTLSKRLELWVREELPPVNGWGPRPSTKVNATVRIDLSPEDGRFDALRAIVAIRQELGQLKKSWPAFDFAFAAYWSSAHPGELLPRFGSRDHGFADAVSGTIGNLASDLGMFDAVSGLGVHAARVLVAEMRRRRMKRLAFDSFDGYQELVERCADVPTLTDPRLDIVVELAFVLALELANGFDDAPLLVVFVDTFERLAKDPRRTGERLFNQLVWTMPNVLFVVTGRDMLDWHKTHRTDLYAVGPRVWPGLILGDHAEPRQHRIGKLSEADTRRVIELGQERFDLMIPEEVVSKIIKASGGLPLYLDLVRAAAVISKENGQGALTLCDVDNSLEQLVLRVFEDIPDDEQRALRAASMFLYFDTTLIAAAADVDHGTAERAVLRPMIDHQYGLLYPYRMHDEIRSSIRTSSHRLQGSWADDDWSAAGTRALREARRRYVKASELAAGPDTLAAIGLAISIACDLEVNIDPSDSPAYSDWLTRAILFGPSIEGLVDYIPVVSRTTHGQMILDFVRSRTSGVSVEEARNLLRPIMESTHPLALPAGRHLAYKLRNNSEWKEAIEVFDELVVRAPNDLHKFQRALTLVNARRFGDAQATYPEFSDRRRNSLILGLELFHGNPHPWLLNSPTALQRIKSNGSLREGLEETGIVLRWRSLVVGDVSTAEIAELLQEAEAVGYLVAIRECLLLSLMAGANNSIEDENLLDRLDYLDRKSTEGRIGYRTALAVGLKALVTDDCEKIPSLVEEINNLRSRSKYWIPVELLFDKLGYPLNHVETDWLFPYHEVKNKWFSIFEGYKLRLVALRN